MGWGASIDSHVFAKAIVALHEDTKQAVFILCSQDTRCREKLLISS